ncbi:hypothetical protein [Halobacteriovorax sp. HLS]|uniref:hypothetical protein n=1 Tax=Halobacteriovorax sp. HLS TaxID=2234000 RepID=UPI000FD8C9E0|nr:hypothetical protein [Halobacteriovorax sp. HLS]
MLRLLLIYILTFSAMGSITQDQFNAVPKVVLEQMQQEIESSGLEISLNLDFESPTVNAGASRKNGKGVINLHGGYAKISPMTVETFALTVCHELGHLIGGMPKVMPTHKYSTEAQSDYFATNYCLKKFLKGRVKEVEIPKFHRDLCQQKYNSTEELVLCYNLMKISIDQLAVDNYLKPKQSHNDPLSLDSSKIALTQYNDYPPVSCRYTTYIYGALDFERPTCWFNEVSSLEDVSYREGYEYAESMFIATAYDVELKPLGCTFKIRNIDYFREGLFASIYEDDALDTEIFTFEKCKVSNGDPISGTLTDYLGKLYFNLNSTDK